jgi:hypothetical protein
VTASAKPVATAASTALPPSRSTACAASVPKRSGEATAPAASARGGAAARTSLAPTASVRSTPPASAPIRLPKLLILPVSVIAGRLAVYGRAGTGASRFGGAAISGRRSPRRLGRMGPAGIARLA